MPTNARTPEVARRAAVSKANVLKVRNESGEIDFVVDGKRKFKRSRRTSNPTRSF